MELEFFSDETKVTVNAAYNYAKENNYDYFSPIHLLIILIKSDKKVQDILNFYKIDKKKLLNDCLDDSNKLSKNSSDTQIQGNLILRYSRCK